jgi:hypothetical protein
MAEVMSGSRHEKKTEAEETVKASRILADFHLREFQQITARKVENSRPRSPSPLANYMGRTQLTVMHCGTVIGFDSHSRRMPPTTPPERFISS